MTGHVFRADDGRLFMQRCPRCGRENYSCAVSSGACAFCGEVAKPHHVAGYHEERAKANNDWPERDWLPVDDHVDDKPAGEIGLPRWDR